MRALTFSRARSSSSSVAGSLAQALELLPDDLHRLAQVVGARADVEPDLARVGELAREREHRVGEPALLAHRLEQPRGGQPAEDRVEHPQREAALVVARDARGRRGRRGTCSVSLRWKRTAGGGCAGAPARASGRASPARRPSSVRSASSTIASWSTEPAAAIDDRARHVARARGRRAIASTGVSRDHRRAADDRAPQRVRRRRRRSPRTSKTVSCGSSSYIAISSSTTWRSGSTSRNAGPPHHVGHHVEGARAGARRACRA